MASILAARLSRPALYRHAVPVVLSLGAGATMACRQPALRMDAMPMSSRGPQPKERLDPQVLKQISAGSLTGFVSGLLVSVFSKTIVLFIGLGIVATQVAARYGINLARYLNLKKWAEQSRVLSSLRRNGSFTLSFGLTFAMAAFLHF